MHIKNIVFDLGNVLIYWDPKNLFDEKYFDSVKKRDYFLENICTADWNEIQDAGRSISEATNETIRLFPEWEAPIRDYYGRWTEMLGGPIKSTVEIFRKLKETGNYRFYALTNWNACLFEIALCRYDFLQWFDGRIVSGEEKMRKPSRAFYQLLTERYHVHPSQTLFIDDNERNTKAAEEMGYKTVLYKSSKHLLDELKKYDISV